jgi:hypothetical protein
MIWAAANPLANGVPENLVLPTDRFSLAPGDFLTATYQVRLNDLVGPYEPSLVNTAFANSASSPFPVSATVVDPVTLGGTIGDSVWLDVDGDGIEDIGEPGLANVTVYLYTDRDGDGDVDAIDETRDVYDGALDLDNNGSVNTGDDGVFYGVRVIDGRLDVDNDGDVDANDDGVVGGYPVINGYLDVNYDGSVTTGDDATDINAPYDSAVTDANGDYLFDHLPAGTYETEVDTSTLPAGLTASPFNPAADPSRELLVTAEETYLDIDFGFTNASTTTGIIGDYVWSDADNDGVQDPGEPGIGGVTVFIDADGDGSLDWSDGDNDGAWDPGEGEQWTTTAPDGSYYLTGVAPGEYQVSVLSTDPYLAGYTPTSGPESPGGYLSDPITLSAGEVYVDADFGFRNTGSFNIADKVWLDIDGDGNQDVGESGIEGVTVDLVDGGGNIIATTTTGADGSFSFTGVGEPTISVTDGLLGGSGFTGLFHGGSFINGRLDVNGDGLITSADDGEFAGYRIIDGYLDLDGDGTAGETNGDDSATSLTFPYTLEITDTNGALSGLGGTTAPADAGVLSVLVNAAADAADGSTDGTISGVNLGYRATGTIGDRVWSDADGDGAQDSGEIGIGGVTVFIDANNNGALDGGELSTTTAPDGSYLFEGLEPGSYNVVVVTSTLPGGGAGYFQTGDPDAACPSAGCDDESTTSLALGETDLSLDFGYDNNNLANISGNVFNDLDSDGVDDGAGEAGFAGVTLALLDSNGNAIGTTVTNHDGDYEFKGVPDGTYTVQVTDTSGVLNNYTLTQGLDSRQVSVSGGADVTDVDFGYIRNAGTGSIGDTVWLDSDKDYVFDAGETGLAGVTLSLYDTGPDGVIGGGDDVLVATTTTNAAGQYVFDGLPAGNYYVDVTDTNGALTGLSPSSGATTDPSAVINLSEGEAYVDADFGYASTTADTYALGDFVWYDADGDGVQDDGELGIGSVDVFICRTSEVGLDGVCSPTDTGYVTTATTAADGSWLVPGLSANYYTASVDTTDVPGYAATTATSIDVALTQDILYADFGFNGGALVTIGDTVFEDRDGDGAFVSGEGLENVTVELYTDPNGDGDTADGALIASVTTDANGNYNFAGLPDGNYVVEVSDLNGVLGTLNPSAELDPAGTTNDGVLDGSTTVVVTGGSVTALGGTACTGCDLKIDFGYESSSGNTYSIGDTVWHDVDGDGVYEPLGDDGVAGTTDDEGGFEGVTLDLWVDVNNNGVIDPGVDNYLRTATTDVNGNYEFTGLPPENYIVDLTDTSGVLDGDNDGDYDEWTLTAGTDVSAVSITNDDVFTVDFGFNAVSGQSLSGWAFADANVNGSFDSGTEPGVGGVTVYLYRQLADGSLVLVGELLTGDGTDRDNSGTVEEDEKLGYYQFDDLPNGDYVVTTDPSGTAVEGIPQTTPASRSVTLTGSGSSDNNFGWGITPTVVSIEAFGAYVDRGDVIVQWVTGFEAGTLGFHLERYDDGSGEYLRLNQELLPSLVFSSGGGVYRFADEYADSGKVSRYRLIEVEYNSAERIYGPFDVKPSGKGKRLDSQFDAEARGADEKTLARYEKAARDNNKGGNGGNGGKKSSKVSAEMVKVLVREDGLYTIPAADLADAMGEDAATVSGWIEAGEIRVSHHGQQVASTHTPDHDALLFYGEAIDSIYTWDNAYWITRQGSAHMKLYPGGAPAAATMSDFPESALVEETETHPVYPGLVTAIGGDPAADNWFWSYLWMNSPNAIGYSPALDVPSIGAADSGEACLTIHAKGYNNDPDPDPDHIVWLQVNGTDVGRFGALDPGPLADPADPGKGAFDGIVRFSYTACFDNSLLVDGVNAVKLAGQTANGVIRNRVLIDRFNIQYRRLFRADDDRIWVRGDGSPVVTVHGFSTEDIEVFGLADPLQPEVVTELNIEPFDGGYRVSFIPADGDTRYLVQTAGRRLAPQELLARPANDLRAPTHRVDHLVIAPEFLAESAAHLADYRSGTGLDSKLISLEQIYDAFNGGVAHPGAIRDFLAYAAAKWKAPPLYVALVGQGSLDYKGYLGLGDNLLPIMLTNTPWGLYACDVCLGDLDDDGVSEFAIGRIPVLSAAELDIYNAKLAAYEAGDGLFAQALLFAADNQDAAGNFPQDSSELAALIPAGFTVQEAYIGPLPAANVRAAILDSFSSIAPKGLVNWVGHGSETHLADEFVLDLGDIDADMDNGNELPLFAALTCSAGRFEHPLYQSLSEALLLHEGGGAIAAFSPTGLSINYDAVQINAALLESLYLDGQARIGDAALDAQADYRSKPGHWRFMLEIYGVMGDPATVLH